jgi:hypothetical protein
MFCFGEDHFQLDRARIEVVKALLGYQPHEVARCSDGLGSGDIPSSEIAATDVNHLALLHQEFHRLPDLLPRSVPIDVVHLVQVDVIGLKAAQAVVACLRMW